MGEKSKIVIICGPTGSGKTAAAIELAQAVGGEIVGADSMQIYRYMDIGTAKPTPEEQARVVHHLIDVVDPDEQFDAARFARMASEKVAAVHCRGAVPFVVGGTGFYIKALVHGLFEAEPVAHDVRDRLRADAARRGTGFLHERLGKCDPEAALRIHPNDTYRIIRALEIFEKTGNTLSNLHHAHRFGPTAYRTLKIGIRLERVALYDRIDRRVDAMLAGGLADEVRHLLASGFSPELKTMQSIGYRHMVGFLRGDFDWEETVRRLKRDTRRYAKRQLTWFRSDPDIRWAAPDAVEEMQKDIIDFLNTEAPEAGGRDQRSGRGDSTLSPGYLGDGVPADNP